MKNPKYLLLTIPVLLIFMLGWSAYWFFDNYTLRSPVILQVPWVSRYHSPLAPVKVLELPSQSGTPTAKPTAAPVKPQSLDFDKIRGLESTWGRAPTGLHKNCEAQNGWNEIGYAASSGYCFKNETEARQTFNAWVAKYTAQGYTQSEMLCMWNEGRRVTNCAYARDYMRI